MRLKLCTKPDGAGYKSSFGEEEDEPTKLSRYGGGAGFSLFPNQHFSIDLGLGYSIFTTKDEYQFLGQTIKREDTTSGLTFDVGFSVFFGGN